MAADPIDGEHVVGVVLGFEVEEQRGKPDRTKRSCAEDRGLEAMGGALAQHAARGPGRHREVVGHVVQESLDSMRSPQRAELAQLARRENVGHRPQSAPTASSSPSFLIAGLVTVNSTTPPTGAVSLPPAGIAWMAFFTS